MPAVTVNDLNNAQLDVNTIASVATSTAPTVTDRLGNTKNTLAGMNAAVLASAAAVQGSIGYLPPVAYAAGISLTLAAQTVGYSGQTYAPILSALPFTTSGTFETAKFRLIQGVSGADLAAPGGAALVGFIQTGTGAIPRTLQQKVKNSIDAQDFTTGDGVTNDTAGFAALESAYTGRIVNLMGLTYVVNKQPTQNAYSNGQFKRASDSHIFQAGRTEPVQANRGAEVTLKSQSDDSRYRAALPPGLKGSMVVLGDSISHGAFVGNSYQNGWVNILKRCLNAETGGKGYGFTPLLTLGSGATLTQEVHDVNISGSWTGLESSSGGGDILQGLAFTSSTPGNTITITCPTFQSNVRLWYIEDVGAGTFSYAVNGGAATNVATAAAARNTAKSVLISMLDNGAGAFSVVLTVVSGSVALCGIGYETSPDGFTAGNVVQNFSQSGRRLRYATEGMVDLACRGSALVLALGYNDSSDVETDPAYNTAFQQVIDWVIKYCLQYNTTLVVPDFCWWSPPSNKARTGLKRAATEARGIYVPLPDYLTRDGLLKTEYSNSFYTIDTLNKWVDTAHPNKNGAKWVAETVAKAMGLSCTAKEQALALHDFPWPLQFDAASPLQNQSAQMPYLSNVRRNGNSLVFSIRAATKTGNALAAGAGYKLNKPLNPANSRQFVAFSSCGIDPAMPINITAAGAVSTALGNSVSNDITLQSVTPYLSTINYAFTMPLDVTANTA